MYTAPRPLADLIQELRELAVCIDHYVRQERFTEEYEARVDYTGLLREICQRQGLDYHCVYHPLLGPVEQAPAGITCLF